MTVLIVVLVFLSTPSARRATARKNDRQNCQTISIHALREEGDRGSPWIPATPANFYPRPPRGGRPHVVVVLPSSKGFLSTPSARRATGKLVVYDEAYMISIHALREEGDVQRAPSSSSVDGFLSTPSARRATRRPRRHPERRQISIHALREEGDKHGRSAPNRPKDFYPRPPRGGRPGKPVRFRPPVQISIHALREEGDASGMDHPRGGQVFLSTPSARRATKVSGGHA